MQSPGARRCALWALRQGWQDVAGDSKYMLSRALGESGFSTGTSATPTNSKSSEKPGFRQAPGSRVWNKFGPSYGSAFVGMRGFASAPGSSGAEVLGMIPDDNKQTAAETASQLPMHLADPSLLGKLADSGAADLVAASGSDLWANVPLISLNLPAFDGIFNLTPTGMCAIFALLAISANHNSNHAFAQAGTSAASSIRKSIMTFWNEQVKERSIRKWRDSSSVSTPLVDTESRPSVTTPTNRVLSYWIAARDQQGLTTLNWLTSLFAVVLASNAFGLIPFSEAITGKAGLTLGLSFAVWGAVTYTGITKMGTKVINLFLPGGISFVMAPFFVLLELISYSFRAVSLGVRLWANMLAGHQLIHIVTGISLVPVFYGAPTLLPVSVIAVGLLMAMTGLETIVCILQSGVFCLLTSFYLQEVLSKKIPITPTAFLKK